MRLYFLFWTLFWLLLVFRTEAQSLKTYKAETSDDEYDIIGLHYKKSANQANVKLTSFTICLRFNYLRIGQTAHIINLMTTDKNEPKLLNLEPRFPTSYIFFGQSKKGKGYFDSEILRESANGTNYAIWKTNMWHHLCVAFDGSTHVFSVVKDGKVTNVNGTYTEDLGKLKLPEEILDMIYVGRCADGTEKCSMHSGTFTDFNLWNEALTDQEMVNWTKCM